MGALLEERRCELVIHKVESHIDENEAISRGFPMLHVRLNKAADKLAEMAATKVMLTESEVQAVRDVDALAARVRQRLAAVLRDVGDKDPRAPRPRGDAARERPRAATPYEAALRETSHSVIVVAGARGAAVCLRCRVCLSEARGSRSTCTEWLRTACGGPPVVPAATSGPGPAGGARPAVEQVRVGGQLTHPSHDLRVHGTVPVWYCARCGATTAREGGVLRGLAKPCLPPGRPPSQAGREALARLAQDLWPGTSREARAWNSGRLRHEGRGARRR